MNLKIFEKNLEPIPPNEPIAVALSGGGDSMALTHLLSEWAHKRVNPLHILHVDHGLRTESKKEAVTIKKWVSEFHYNQFKILVWKHTKTISKKIQEEARTTRYALMADYCKKNKIKYLCTAHHKDDQAETILFRLAKGSGIDGMAGMNLTYSYDKNLTILRPCLAYTHDELINHCQKKKLNWLEDPSNSSEKFARVRLRKASEVLKTEGLTADRLAQFAKRCTRAKEALTIFTAQSLQHALITQTKKEMIFNLSAIKSYPLDIIIRILSDAITTLYPKRTYPPALEVVETIAEKILEASNGKATIANCLISWSKTKATLTVKMES